MVVLPRITQPASRRRAAGGASSGCGGASSFARVPIGAGTPRVWMFSLMVSGTPSSGESGVPASRRASAARACSSAPSRSTRYIAFSLGSSSAMRASAARVASMGESSPRRKAAASSAALRSCKAAFTSRIYTAHDMLRCAILGLVLACAALPARAQWEIRFWHAMSGAPQAELESLVERFNAAQEDYRVVLSYKGSYDETLAAVIATQRRFSWTSPPHIVQVQEPRTAGMLARRGLVKPLWQVLQ